MNLRVFVSGSIGRKVAYGEIGPTRPSGNAAASGVAVREIVAPVDRVMFCAPKALGAPVGSLLTGPAEAMARGRLYRKRLGAVCGTPECWRQPP